MNVLTRFVAVLGIIKTFFIVLLFSSCLGSQIEPEKSQVITVDWQISPSPVVKGPVELQLQLANSEGKALSAHTKVSVEANMTHPGMVPVLAEALPKNQEEGTFVANFNLTMGGDWILFLTIELPDGTIVNKELSLPGVR